MKIQFSFKLRKAQTHKALSQGSQPTVSRSQGDTLPSSGLTSSQGSMQCRVQELERPIGFMLLAC